jgi:hypothetical protein
MSTKAIMIVAAFALMTATALTSPASARSRSQAYNSESGTYAYQHKRTHRAHRSRNAYDVRGWYRGSDPDPFIRDQLKRCREC